MDSLIPLSAPTKLVPLSEKNNLVGPLWFINVLRTLMKQSVSRELANSRCTRVHAGVNIARLLLTTALPLLMLKKSK